MAVQDESNSCEFNYALAGSLTKSWEKTHKKIVSSKIKSLKMKQTKTQASHSRIEYIVCYH